MQWVIRPAIESEFEEIERFTDAAWHAYHIEQNHDLSYDWESQQILLIASRDDRRIAGVARGRIGAGVGHLGELIVDSEVRGQGIGTRLLEEFEAWCWDASCHKLTVMTELDGPARPFYEQRGWRVEAVFERDRGGNDFVRLMKFQTGQPAGACGEGDSE